MRQDRPTARAAFIRGLEAFLSQYPGVSASRLIADAALAARRVDDAGEIIDLAAAHALLTAAARVAGDPAFGVKFAAQLPWKDLGVLAHVALSSPTVGAALGNVSRYFGVQSTGGRVALDVARGVATVTHSVRGVDKAPQVGELALAVLTRLIRDGSGQAGWKPREVRFVHDAPERTTVHDRFFAAPVRWSQPADQLVLAATDLRLPMQTADEDLLPILVRVAEERLARMPPIEDLGGDVRSAVAGALRAGEPHIDGVAAVLGTSARSLQRHLRERGHSFQALLADTRLELCRGYLADPSLTLTDTAFLLGYADLSAFSRAYRRWTGETALTARRRALRRPRAR